MTETKNGPFSMARTIAFFSVVGLLGACGSQSNNSDVISCQNDSRVMAYAPNVSVNSTGGMLKLTLVQANPAPPAVGTNDWTVRATNMSGQAIANLVLSIDPRTGVFMPDHGHGPSVYPQVTANGDGSFAVSLLDFFMPGVWRITFNATTDTGAADTAIFYFCVPG